MYWIFCLCNEMDDKKKVSPLKGDLFCWCGTKAHDFSQGFQVSVGAHHGRMRCGSAGRNTVSVYVFELTETDELSVAVVIFHTVAVRCGKDGVFQVDGAADAPECF